MNPDNRNLWLAIVLSVAILIGWQVVFPDQALFSPPDEAAQQAQTEQQVSQQGAQGGGGASGQSDVPTAGSAPSAPGSAPTAAQGDAGLTRAEALAQAPRVTIETPSLSGSINLEGARFDDLTLKDYHVTVEEESPLIDLLQPAAGAAPYYAQFGWAQIGDVATPDRQTRWQASSDHLSVGEPVTLSWSNGQGQTFEQEIAIDANYMITVTQRVVNESDAAVSAAPYGLVSRTGTPAVSQLYILHEGLIGVLDGGLEEIDYDDLRDAEGARRSFKTTGGWMGITDKYWLVSLIPDQGQPVDARYTATKAGVQDRYQVDFLSPTQAIQPGESVERTSRLFAGAKRTLLLDEYEAELGIPNFDLAVDFGWFYFLTKPIFFAIHWLNGILGNFGLAILALTLVIKLAFFPLANKSYRSMSKMKLLQPKMQELKEKYGDDRQKMNQELMGLYKKEQVNPMSGCLPILVQIPVFFSLYKVLYVTIEMRHAPFFGWIEDLSAPDPLGLLTAFGLFDYAVPEFLQVVNIGVWPVIMGLSMFLQQKLNPTPSDPIQQKVFTFMPLIFTFLLAHFPAGLVIYWAWNNTLSIAQQYVIMRRMGVAVGGGKSKSS
ncbi:membrane protein insertase YidC [Marivibrio halodurans]|uniref:Membrane protein insertase YidC n=1 Tax=Marivibrio halodurans TaxID=2039722 RepID=A0A8J7SP02_9PROT|nr:membrane protein insertase YidC [Marivibrio halodurans]MBP5858021.1 membrane protein insertase YidC [Marivibrio halodurans]